MPKLWTLKAIKINRRSGPKSHETNFLYSFVNLDKTCAFEFEFCIALISSAYLGINLEEKRTNYNLKSVTIHRYSTTFSPCVPLFEYSVCNTNCQLEP